MEIRIFLFIALSSVSVIFNTVVIWSLYKAFSGLTSKVTETVSEFERNREARAWIESLKVAAEQAVAVSAATKKSITDFEPILERTQASYSRTLATVDARLEATAAEITATATKMRDAVAKPAFSLMAFVVGMARVLGENNED